MLEPVVAMSSGSTALAAVVGDTPLGFVVGPVVVEVEAVVVVVAAGVTVIDRPSATTEGAPATLICDEVVVHTPLASAEEVAVAEIDADWPTACAVHVHEALDVPGAEVLTYPLSGPVVVTPDSDSVPVVPPVTVSAQWQATCPAEREEQLSTSPSPISCLPPARWWSRP